MLRFKYRNGGKEKLLALGVYPDLSLSDANDKRDEARNQLAKDKINWEEKRWELPASKMKMKEPHIVPLAKQAINTPIQAAPC